MTHPALKVTPFPATDGLMNSSLVAAVKLNQEGLFIEVHEYCNEPKAAVVLTFSRVHGIRVLDEAHQCQFWPECSGQNQFLYQIEQGGWADDERERTDAIGAFNPAHLEFLITGVDDCVNVICEVPPTIQLKVIN